MSYLVSAVIEQPKEGQTEIPFFFIGGFDGMNWHLAKHKKNPKKALLGINIRCKKILLEEPNGVTTIEKLKTAPLDEVIIITGEDTYESMKNRKSIRTDGINNPQWAENHLKI